MNDPVGMDLERIALIAGGGLSHSYNDEDAPDDLRLDSFVIAATFVWTDEDGEEKEGTAVWSVGVEAAGLDFGAELVELAELDVVLARLELAALMGWRDNRGWIDTARVNRVLGLTRYAEGHGHGPAIRQGVNWATAQAIRAALDAYAEQCHSRNPDRTPTEH